MLKHILIGVVCTVVVAALAGYAAVRAGVMPANADARPPAIEVWAAKTSLHATLRRSAPKVANPLAASDRNLIAGINLYAQNCAICHGDAKSKPTLVARGLYQRPPQLAEHGVEDDPDGIIYWKLRHGIRWTGMPAFGTLGDTRLWQLTLFLKTMDHLPPTAQQAWKRVRANG